MRVAELAHVRRTHPRHQVDIARSVVSKHHDLLLGNEHILGSLEALLLVERGLLADLKAAYLARQNGDTS